MDNSVLEPLKYYESQGKQTHADNIEAHLKQLIEKSGVDVDANSQTIKKWKKEQDEIFKLSKIIKKFKLFRTLLILAIIIGSITALVSIAYFSQDVITALILLAIGIVFIVVPIIVIVKKIKPVIKGTEKVKQQHVEESKKLENEGWGQMQSLNDLFTDEDAVNLIEKTLPEFTFDKNFSVEQEKLFIDKYDFRDLQTEDCSMLDTLSGKFAGNPFLFGRRKIHQLGSHTYHGSLVISWTETYRDSNGQLRTRRRTQTLHASVVKPKPFYSTNTFLAFGNQAAPNLAFSRKTAHTDDLSERALERKIKKGEKKLQKQAKQAIKKGGNFQEMANTEFDVLFGATNRNNEVEFRLMYTPLGQRNTVDILKDKNNYGDDFDFIKQGKCNLVFSDHAQNWKMHLVADDYKHFDYEEIKSRFTEKNQNYFKSIFFDFAPFLCVPAYLEEPCVALDGDESYNANYTYYEHEVMANAFNYNLFVHEDSWTDAILKTNVIHTETGKDLVSVTANSYTGINRVDYIPVLGGDGHFHSVPVPWVEYIPINKTTNVLINSENTPSDRPSIFYHGMNAEILNN